MGAVRVVRLSDQECRIANMFMLPEYQGCGYAKKALKQVERLYPFQCFRFDSKVKRLGA